MISVAIEMDAGGIVVYHSLGHAQGQGRGLTVCNGLSAIEYQFLYSIKDLCPDSDLDFRVEKGDFRMVRGKEIPEGGAYQTLCRSFIIGIEMLKKHHPDMIDVKIIRI